MANFKKTDKGYSKKTTTPKTKYVQKEIYLGSSDVYNEIIPSLNDLLGKITFDLVNVPVTMAKSVAFGNKELTGHVNVGTVMGYKDGVFTINMPEEFAEKINEESVIIVRCRKNFDTNEVTYVTNIYITKGTPVVGDAESLTDTVEVVASETSVEVTE